MFVKVHGQGNCLKLILFLVFRYFRGKKYVFEHCFGQLKERLKNNVLLVSAEAMYERFKEWLNLSVLFNRLDAFINFIYICHIR